MLLRVRENCYLLPIPSETSSRTGRGALCANKYSKLNSSVFAHGSSRELWSKYGVLWPYEADVITDSFVVGVILELSLQK